MNLLIPYVPLFNHPDPLFLEFTYGDGGQRAKKLKKLIKGDYVFFHTSIRGKKYITAYYIVDRILDTDKATKDKRIMDKYKNPHLSEFLSGQQDEGENCILFGDPITSKILKRPLLFNTTCLNSSDVSPGMETVPKSSFSMIKSRHGNPETSPLCLQMYVPYSLDPEIQVRGTGKGSG